MNRRAHRRGPSRAPVSWLILLTLIVAAAGFLQTGVGRAVVRSGGVGPAHDHFTALSFTDPSALPDGAPYRSAGHETGSRQIVSFDVKNETGNARSYGWSVEVVPSGAAPLAGGRVAVRDGETVTVRRAVTVPCPTPRVRVQVSLPGADDTIGYWTHCHARVGT